MAMRWKLMAGILFLGLSMPIAGYAEEDVDDGLPEATNESAAPLSRDAEVERYLINMHNGGRLVAMIAASENARAIAIAGGGSGEVISAYMRSLMRSGYISDPCAMASIAHAYRLLQSGRDPQTVFEMANLRNWTACMP